MDYKTTAAKTIQAVRHATAKEDEEYGGEVFAERLTEALEEAGINLDSKEDLEGAWYGAPDEVLVKLITAFIEDQSMTEQDDPGVSRVIYDLHNALEQNPHLEQSHPEFWNKAMAVL